MFNMVHERKTTCRSTRKNFEIKSSRLSAIVMQESLMFYCIHVAYPREMGEQVNLVTMCVVSK